MATSAVQKSISPSKKGTPKKSKPITWEHFQKRYLSREDGYKYEWLNGTIEKTQYAMDKTQLYLLRNLLAFFRDLLKAGKVKGELIPEADLFFLENHRRPDISWLTNKQIDRLADGEYEVPDFIIEVLSTRDAIYKVVDKMNDYRAAKVRVVWHVLPQHEEVHVYSGIDLENMTICKGEKVCSAQPALPDFALPAKDIFQKTASERK